MADLIDRQKTLEKIYQLQPFPIIDRDAYEFYRDVRESIKSMPSAQQWTPVTERLPEFKERVLVYAEDDKSWYIAISQMLSLSPLKGCFLGFNGTQKVKAWMPLPECYRGESDGE